MNILTKLFLIFGVASVTYGFARWQVLMEVLSRQDAHFEEFFAAHSSESTVQITKQDVFQLYKRVMLSAGPHTGWSQAVIPVALGLMFFAIGYYSEQKKGGVKDGPAA